MEQPYYWDGKIDYLKRSTAIFYNDDYIEFLTGKVWKIDKPVDVIDFGCGYGHLGLRLLPLLPPGSTYTGVDAGETLIGHATELFKALPYQTAFIRGDIHTVPLERKYDLAVCHAVLLHMERPEDILRRMKDCVVDHGKIICFEPNWIANMASYYFEGIEQSQGIRLGVLQKLYERDAGRTGKDGNIGMKLPVYFRELGLRNVDCRVSDKVNILDPGADPVEARSLFEAICFEPPGDKQSFIDGLAERGLTAAEAEQLYEAERLLALSFTEATPAVYAPSMKITFGTVER